MRLPSLKTACVSRFDESYESTIELLGVKPEPMIESRPLDAVWRLPAASVALTRITALRVGAISGGTGQVYDCTLPAREAASAVENVAPPSVESATSCAATAVLS